MTGFAVLRTLFDEFLWHDLFDSAARSIELETQSIKLVNTPMESLELGQQHHFSSDADQALGSGSGDGHSRCTPGLLMDVVLQKHIVIEVHGAVKPSVAGEGVEEEGVS
ncbi:hypothetical protein Mapa_007003 [Marchantia paleacea]|nr:hypothetical protein Mapa_007003 [Marchantia paleacea]